MNFIKAIQYATLGHRIRRAEWAEGKVESGNCHWLILGLGNELWWDGIGNVATGCIAKLTPSEPDLQFDLLATDINAIDWEVESHEFLPRVPRSVQECVDGIQCYTKYLSDNLSKPKSDSSSD